MYCQSQLDAIFEELRGSMFGNPHSANPSSHLSSEKVEEVRDLVLKYFKADPAEYQVGPLLLLLAWHAQQLSWLQARRLRHWAGADGI